MAKDKKPPRPKARLPKGLRDIPAAEIRARDAMLRVIRDVYESYGFEPLDTPAFEYTDALGKFLPDQDRPNEGVFSFQDEDEQWLSLRYDLTAPLARYVAENFDSLPKPFRRYQVGPVWRNEKPGPGRFREFLQFDADTVGAASVAADAEMCMLAADTLEALGIARGDYVIKINNRKVLDGVLESNDVTDEWQKLTVLRALDKYDRLGEEGVKLLLGKGRKDESGDFTKGAELQNEAINHLIAFVVAGKGFLAPFTEDETRPMQDMQRTENNTFVDCLEAVRAWGALVAESKIGSEGVRELREIVSLCEASGFGSMRIVVDSSVVRGLEYYTGPVFEAELTFETLSVETDSKTGSPRIGQPTKFGSVGGGGRYDGLVARFRGQEVPATGFSIGVSRLLTALQEYEFEARGYYSRALGPVVVTVFDKERMAGYQAMVQELRAADIRAELYLGNPNNKGAQFKYADQRGSPCVVIQGPDEKEKGEVQIKDLVEGAKAAETIASNEEWRSERPAQFAVKRDKLVEAVREVLARHENS